MNNGFQTSDEEDSRGNEQICCLVDEGVRCLNTAGE